MADNLLGKLANVPVLTKDAMHVAVIAVTADVVIQPGEPVRMLTNEYAVPCSYHEATGIADPFYIYTIPPGARFWLLLFPNTVSNLRHDWDHDAFKQIEEQDNLEYDDGGCRNC